MKFYEKIWCYNFSVLLIVFVHGKKGISQITKWKLFVYLMGASHFLFYVALLELK